MDQRRALAPREGDELDAGKHRSVWVHETHYRDYYQLVQELCLSTILVLSDGSCGVHGFCRLIDCCMKVGIYWPLLF